MNAKNKDILNVLLYLVVFIAISILVTPVVMFVLNTVSPQASAHGGGGNPLLSARSSVLVWGSAIGNVLTIALFVWRRWSPFSRVYLRSRPWAVLLWVALLGLGAILPLEWIYEQLNLTLPIEMEEVLKSMMSNRWGYLALGILAPIAEEMVFRGAILRSLLRYFNGRMPWIPIVVSALLFGLVHGNVAQSSNAFLMGLLLGWFYHRTGSIVPGIVLHWINNTVAYVMYQLLPHQADGRLIDLFHGDDKRMYLGLLCSLLIFAPALFQLSFRLKKPTDSSPSGSSFR